MVLLGMDGNNSRAYAVPMSLCPAVRTVQVPNKFIHRQQLQSLATTPATIKVVLEDFQTCDGATARNIVM